MGDKFLKNVERGTVFVWSELLAAQDKMVPCDVKGVRTDGRVDRPILSDKKPVAATTVTSDADPEAIVVEILEPVGEADLSKDAGWVPAVPPKEDEPVVEPPVKRGRGRPKGSKNKPKTGE